MSLFEEHFEVSETSKKFEKVTRLVCKLVEEAYELRLDLDVNSDLYPLEVGNKFTLLLATTVDQQGAPSSGKYDPKIQREKSLMDQYEYVMHGKIYKWKQETTKHPIEVHISYGGLLMRLKGDPRHLQKLELDSRVFLLMRKLAN